MSACREVTFLGIQHLKIVKIKRLADGKESVSYNFTPATSGVTNEFLEFLMMPDVAWRTCGVDELNGAVRRYVEGLREKGEVVELSVSDCGIVRFDLLFNGEHRSLWFNAHTSDTVVLDTEGKVCENVRNSISGT